jgi:hypothetical protein
MKKPFTKGRWYRFFVESDGTKVTLSEKDNINASIENNKLILPKDFTVAACFNELHTIEAEESNVCRIVYDTDGLTKVELPTKNFDHGYIYIQGFFS